MLLTDKKRDLGAGRDVQSTEKLEHVGGRRDTCIGFWRGIENGRPLTAQYKITKITRVHLTGPPVLT